jgi:hypothetical protein
MRVELARAQISHGPARSILIVTQNRERPPAGGYFSFSSLHWKIQNSAIVCRASPGAGIGGYAVLVPYSTFELYASSALKFRTFLEGPEQNVPKGPH